MGCGSSRVSTQEIVETPGFEFKEVLKKSPAKTYQLTASKSNSGSKPGGLLDALALVQSNFLPKRQNSKEIDVIQWGDQFQNDENFEDVLEQEEDEQDLEIISIKPNTFAQSLDDALKRYVKMERNHAKSA